MNLQRYLSNKELCWLSPSGFLKNQNEIVPTEIRGTTQTIRSIVKKPE